MRETPNTTSLLIEYGFIDNANDAVRLQNNLLDYVEAVVKAVTNYIGVPYVSTEGITENTYIVQKGDSLYSIATKFNITVDRLKELNNLTSNNLQIGQVLIVSESITPTPTPPATGDYIIYTVKSGDSLWSIANKYEVTVSEIVELNNLGTTLLQVGQQLRIPTITISEPNYYTVKRGDSLWSIANQYNTTVNKIRELNNLTSNTLQIGQVLRIPNTAGNNYITYTVKSGDSLWKIANQYNVSVTDLISANNLTSTTLQIGQVLRIPQ